MMVFRNIQYCSILSYFLFMNKWTTLLIVIVFCFCGRNSQQKNFKFPSEIKLISSRRELVIASDKTNQIATVDIDNFRLKKKISLENSPTGIAISENGESIYVSAGLSNGVVYVIDSERKKIINEIPVGHSPVSPVIGNNSGFLFVCNQFARTISVVDLNRLKVISRISVPGEPISAALTKDGKFLFVVNHLPVQPSNVSPVSSEITVIDIEKREAVNHINLPNGSTGLKDIVISSDGNFAYITHLLAHYELPTTRVDGGWMNANALSIIDVRNHLYQNTLLLDRANDGAANPWGIECTPDGNYLCISHFGTDELSILDRKALHEKLQKSNAGTEGKKVCRDLDFLSGIRRRVKSGGIGPRELLITGDSKLYVANYFTGNLGMIDFKQDPARVIPIQIFRKYDLTSVEKGEMYFHSGKICFQQWQSCASCHPDGRADALNWDLLNDGIGNPKGTKSLLLSHKTPPVMTTGIRKDAETAVRSGIQYILFSVQPEEVPEAIDEFLKSLEPVPSPFLENNRLSESAKRGEKIFSSQEVGCVKCHPKPYYTDLKTHNVGTHSANDFTIDKKGDYIPQVEFDTPSLIELWRTGPYFHDGRYSTIKEVITEGNHKNIRGNTSNLTESEVNDLVLYLLSL